MGAGQATEEVAASLRAIVGARHVRTSLPDRLAYARDCWPRGVILTRGQRYMVHEPEGVVQPGTEAEVAEVLRVLSEARVPVVPYGAGSGVCGGVTPDRGGFVVDVKRLRAVEAFDREALLIRVGAGMIGMDLETDLLRQGYTLGHYPSSLYCSSVGGYLAARSAGQQSSRFGKIEDMVQTLRVVTGTGEVIDTAPGLGATRWSGGPDWTQCVVGSEGTLGVITSGVLRVFPKPELQHYRGWQCPTVEDGIAAQRALMQAGLRPCVMRLYDEFDTLIAGKGKGEVDEGLDAARELLGAELPSGMLSGLWSAARRAIPQDVGFLGDLLPGLSARLERAARGLLGRVVGQPLWLNQLTEALPGGCLLIVGFEGDAATCAAEAEAAEVLLRRYGTALGPGPGEHWLENRFNVSYKQSPLFDAGAFVDTMEVSTTWANLVPLYYAVKDAVAEHAFIMAHFSHAYPEGASIYFTFAGFGADLDESLERYEATWAAAQGAVVAQGASPAHHHGVGLSKASRTEVDHAGGAPLFAALKAAFDPAGVMNPGKVWPGVGAWFEEGR